MSPAKGEKKRGRNMEVGGKDVCEGKEEANYHPQ